MGHAPSIQQKAVYRWIRDGDGNLILVAVAGAGKTTTILNGSTLMRGFVNICAYNKKIAVELTGKLKAANQPSRIQAGTFHSFGLRNWRKMAPKLEIDGRKVSNLCERSKVPEELQEFVVDLVSLGKQRALGVLGDINDGRLWRDIVDHYDVDEALPIDPKKKAGGLIDVDQMVEDGIGYAIGIYKKSLEMDQDLIDYDDMILAPLIHNARMWQNDWLLVDEAQDTNPARRELAKRMLKPGGRAIFVGDPAQAIYGFTGADNDSLDIIKKEFQCTELPLTVTYRCPKSVVQMARQWVSHITAHDSAPEGVVTEISEDQFRQLPPEMFTDKAAMLCRTTAPLVGLAYSLIRRGIPCHIEGKEIGRGLLLFVDKFKTGTLDVLQKKMSDYVEKEVKKFMEKKQDKKAEALVEKAECVNVLISVLPVDSVVADLKDHIRKLFGDMDDDRTPPHFVLSTVHKSKGREWPTVYLYNRRELMPSRFARQDWQLQQENNLIYVAVTRSMGSLVEVVR
jgi:DNA helicase-2/ATP-dependent DNA helicase PcrA